MRPRRPTSSVTRVVSAALLVTLLPSLAHTQAYQRIAPQVPPAAPPPEVTPPPEPKPPLPASNAVVLPALLGLVFLPDAAAVRPAGLPANAVGRTGIQAAGLPLLADPGFIVQVAPFIGRPLHFADLQDITSRITAWYRTHGRPFVSVTVPPQNVNTGIVQVVVTEYRVGTLTVAGNQWFSTDLLRQESGLVPGQTLTLPAVQDDLDWLNANPFRTVTTLFQPGTVSGTTDVTLQTQDRLPVHVYAGFDNAGVPSLGRGEWNVGGVWGNAFGADQTLAYQFTRAFSGRYDAHALSWTVPTPWRDKLLIFGSFAQETPEVGSLFGETGSSGQASLRYVHTLPRLTFTPGIELTETIQFGYDFKTTNNNLEFGGTSVFNSLAEINQFLLVYDATLTDPYGRTVLDNQLVASPGGLTGANTTAAFQAVTPGATADYVYDRIGLTRTTFLPIGPPLGFSWTTRVLGQVSDRNLLDSEQLGAGGAGSVRGYFTDAALGSEGVLVSQEIRAPGFSLGGILRGLGTGSETEGNAQPVIDREQLGVFWDYGHVVQVRAIQNGVNAADLSSVGIDLHATLGRYVDLAFDIGWQLRDAPGTDKRGAFGDIAFVVGF